MAASSEYVEPTYGNWRIPVRAGIGRMSGLATILLFAVLIITMMVLKFAGLLAGILTGLVGVLLILGLSYKDKHGFSVLERSAERTLFMFAKRSKKNMYRSGPLHPVGTYKLPGVVSSCKTYEGKDASGRGFTVVHMPAVGIYSIAIGVEPDGAALVDREDIDQWVANWGGFLAELGREIGLVGAAATVETSPGSGMKIRKEIESSLSDEATPLARQALYEAATDYPAGVAQTRCWVTLSFSAAARSGSKKRTPEEMLREFSSNIPHWCTYLEGTGAGIATPLSKDELAEIIRIAYDPAAARLFEDAYYRDETVQLELDAVGPSATEVDWNTYRHDSGVSMCWTMSEAPRGNVFSNVFARLLSPHYGIDRKRVTLIYRPIESARTATIAEQDQNRARTRLTSKKYGSARLEVDLAAANATANEEARGAGLTYFGMIVSATMDTTVRNEEHIKELAAIVEQELEPASRIKLRRAYGAHDAAFAATLPLGVMLNRHTVLPEMIRSAL